jgi:hypothetical protein
MRGPFSGGTSRWASEGWNPMSSDQAPNRFEVHAKKTLLVILLAIVALTELSVRVLAQYGFVRFFQFPVSERPTILADLDENFGAWHYPNATFVKEEPCFKVTYRTNSYGARDEERSLESDASDRILVIGDSFVEGYGIERADRMTNVLERETGIEHLNFGIENFGSIQAWLMYKTFASRWDHSRVFVFLFPDNDFNDNRHDEDSDDSRYRPHLRKIDSGFEIWYPVDFGGPPAARSQSKIIKNRIYNNFYVMNLVRQEMKNFNRREREHQRVPYEDFDDEDMEVLLYTYRKLAEQAGDREVFFFIIPREMDLSAAARGGYSYRLVSLLEEFAAGIPNVEVVDLLPHFAEYAAQHEISYDDFFHTCNGHWSPLGNRVAAEAVVQAAHPARARRPSQ